MRVLIVHSRYLSGDTSGENRVVADETRLMREAGHDAWVWSPSPSATDLRARGRAAASAVWSASAAHRVATMVRRHAIDVVHVHNIFPMLSPTVLKAARRSGAAVVMTLHNYRLMCLPATFHRDGKVCEDCLGRTPWRGVVYRCYRDSLAGSGALASSLSLHRALGSFDSVTRFLAVSEFVKRKHLDAGISPYRILVKPNFSWPTRPREGPGSYFLFLGRLTPEKGVDILLDAWRVGQAPGRLVVVGDGPQAAELRRSVPPGVEFRPAVAADEVPEVIARARAVLVPSRLYEAAPKTIIEAYAAGVPVLASDIGALSEFVQRGVSGHLVTGDDAAAWASAVHALADDAECERLGEGAVRLWKELYTPERGLARLEDAYREAIACMEVEKRDRHIRGPRR